MNHTEMPSVIEEPWPWDSLGRPGSVKSTWALVFSLSWGPSFGVMGKLDLKEGSPLCKG